VANSIFARRKSGKNARIPPCLAASHIKFRGWLACNDQLETANGEIMCLYQAVNRRIEVVPGVGYWGLRPLQIWPHLPALLGLSLLRTAASAIRIIGPGHDMRRAGPKVSASE
jgi:hypothetical protein